ncbi:MAG TPA: sigma factor, partial [Bryobacteraceae bacterium]|nr:sigma factor [Bryobacteraceae bacterium]
MSVIAQGIVLRDAKLSADRRAFADDREFAALVERQSRFVFRIAYAVLRNVHDAEDAAQDVFLKIHRTNGHQNMRDERAFLARAAWRAAVDRLPKNSPRCEGTGEISQVSIEQELIRVERYEAVARLVDALPDDLRMPLVLSSTEG